MTSSNSAYSAIIAVKDSGWADTDPRSWVSLMLRIVEDAQLVYFLPAGSKCPAIMDFIRRWLVFDESIQMTAPTHEQYLMYGVTIQEIHEKTEFTYAMAVSAANHKGQMPEAGKHMQAMQSANIAAAIFTLMSISRIVDYANTNGAPDKQLLREAVDATYGSIKIIIRAAAVGGNDYIETICRTIHDVTEGYWR